MARRGMYTSTSPPGFRASILGESRANVVQSDFRTVKWEQDENRQSDSCRSARKQRRRPSRRSRSNAAGLFAGNRDRSLHAFLLREEDGCSGPFRDCDHVRWFAAYITRHNGLRSRLTGDGDNRAMKTLIPLNCAPRSLSNDASHDRTVLQPLDHSRGNE